MKLSTLLVFLFIILNASAQKYASVDAKVQSFGALADFNVATIADTITRPFAEKDQKARAIYYWITHNIANDPKGTKGNDKKNNEPEKVIALRKATPLGYSLLVQEMCSDAKIRCLSIDGYLKSFAEEIINPGDEINHSWNVVQLEQSPDTWYYIDAFKGAGSLDKKMSVFTPDFTSAYFFADRQLFNLDHFPDNSAWQLGPGPKNLKDFYALPVFSSAAYALGLGKPTPEKGLIKTKTTTPVNFQFPYNGKEISLITLLSGEGKRQHSSAPIKFSISNNTIFFSFTFKEEDEYPVIVVVDGKELVSYQLNVVEK